MKISGSKRFCFLLAWSEVWERQLHTVIIRVLDGGEGSTSGGRSERSIDSGDFGDFGDLVSELARDREGEGISTDIVLAMIVEGLKIIWGEVCCWSALVKSEM
jgi:hypothetical protein